jgi:serine/threonine protein kinase
VPYRSPEMIMKDQSAIGPASDVWSVACCAFEIFTGCCLFDPQNSSNYQDSERSTQSGETSHDMNYEHLVLMEEILGPMPKKIAKRYRQYYNSKGKLKNRPLIDYSTLLEYVQTYCDQYDEEFVSIFHDLLEHMLRYNRKVRYTAEQCLSHSFLQNQK